ncbi:MAG: 30S ribosomal protein S1 [Victivallales bacterium]|nr:30S ribosomal protein S1 [Victivallales bacterium]
MSTSKFVNFDENITMEELLQQAETAEKQDKAEGIYTGRITRKTDKGVYLDIHSKGEPFVSCDEINNFADLKEGDTLDVYVEPSENPEDDYPTVSVHKALVQKAWEDIVQNHEEGGLIKGLVKAKVKGGLIVDVGVEAFLPGSQVDIGPVKNLDDFLNQELEFKILKIDAERRNIVLSRREILEAERDKKRDALLADLQPKQIRRGIVKNITDFGAFVDLDGMDGLLHITDMSWGRVNHPSEVVKVGQEIEVMVLEVDRERKRISLGLKQKEGNPWDTVDVKYPKGSRVKGKVVNVMPYGAFVELEEGIEGLIHVSEMSWVKKVNRASDILNAGDEVEAVVLDVNKEDRKISLGLRQTQENPWELIKQEFPAGTHIKGKVRNMTGYGAFVQIKDDIDGMIHVSDMSWIRKINHPSEVLQKGQEVEAVIVEVDPVNQRISLSMRDLTDDPWRTIQEKYKVGDIVEGKVTKLASFGAFVELEGGIDGLIHISELSDDHVAKVKDVVQAGAVVKCRVKNIDTASKRIGLSMKDVDGESSAAPASGSASSADFGGLSSALDAAFEAAKEEKSE